MGYNPFKQTSMSADEVKKLAEEYLEEKSKIGLSMSTPIYKPSTSLTGEFDTSSMTMPVREPGKFAGGVVKTIALSGTTTKAQLESSLRARMTNWSMENTKFGGKRISINLEIDITSLEEADILRRLINTPGECLIAHAADLPSPAKPNDSKVITKEDDLCVPEGEDAGSW